MRPSIVGRGLIKKVCWAFKKIYMLCVFQQIETLLPFFRKFEGKLDRALKMVTTKETIAH